MEKCAAEFKRDRESIRDDPREGRPKMATTTEIIEKNLCWFNKEAIADVDGYFAALLLEHYRDVVMALEHRWTKCINNKGNYVEK